MTKRMIKNILWSILGSFLIITSSKAQPKIDAGKTTKEVFGFVQEAQKKAEDMQKEVMKQVESATKVGGNLEGNSIIGNIRSGMDKANSLKDSATSTVNGAVGTATGAVGSATGAVNGAVGTATGAVGSATGAVNGAVGTATGAVGAATGAASGAIGNGVNAAAGSVTSGTSSANNTDQYNLIALQTKQIDEIQQVRDQLKDIEDECVGKHDKYNEEIAKLEKLKEQNPEVQSQIDEYNQQMQANEEECRQRVEEKNAEIEQINQNYNQQINELKANAGGTNPLNGNTVTGAAGQQVSNLLGGSGSSGSSLDAIIAPNFYPTSNPTRTPQSDGEIDTYRKQVELNDSADVYYQALQIMADGDNSIDVAEEFRSNAQATETTPAAVMLGISINVEQMKSLHKFAKLLIAEMKQSTARDVMKMDRVLNNYEKDMTKTELDSYKKKKKKKKKNK